MTQRVRFALCSVVMDGVALAAAYFLALFVHDSRHFAELLSGGRLSADLSLALILGITLFTFLAFGLYEQEVYVFRPLLLRTVVKAVLVATVVSAATVYLLKSSYVNQSRFLVLGTFFFFTVFALLLRIAVLARLYGRTAARRRPVTLLVGHSARGEVLSRRLSDLRGFTRWRHVQPDIGDAGAVSACEPAAAVAAALDDLRAQGRAVTAVFVDADGLPLPAVLPAVQAVRDRHITVYVVTDLLRPMHSNRRLFDLFEAPVIRVRAKPPNGAVRRAKRVFDIAGSCSALVTLAVPMLVIALAVKLSSPGPMLYRQPRIGCRGRAFEFLKFRSMVLGDHDDVHRDYVQALIGGAAQACDYSDGEEHVAELKMDDDARVTRVGRFLRRYSLDELPQFWNVLRGDMSLVGPRPPLPYEVEVYNDWQRRRLGCVPGVSGLWQVGGRSRVTYDQMVFQDLFYDLNQSPLLDVLLCLRTVPAVLNGRGAQ